MSKSSVKKCSPKFYNLNIYGKTRAMRQESARPASPRDYLESSPERRVSLFRFCDHGLVRMSAT